MNVFVPLVGALLSWLHGYFGLDVCPGDWAWTLTGLGAVTAAFPVAGVVLVLAIRHVTGNRLSLGTVTAFAGIGVFTSLVVPWAMFGGASDVFRAAFRGFVPAGMGRAELATLGERFCFVVQQRAYLGNGQIGSTTLFTGQGIVATVLHAVTLVVLPAIGVFGVILIGRAAFRRGPRWPSRFFWVPFAVLPFVTTQLTASVLAQLWVGFVPASLLGAIAVRLLPPPSWAAINRSAERRREQPPEPAADPLTPPPAAPMTPPPARPMAEPMASQPLPTPLDGDPGDGRRPPELPGPTVEPPRDGPARLATAPGRMPFEAYRNSMPQQSTAAAVGADRGVTAAIGPPIAGRFVRLQRLGRGGMGTVWLAEDSQLGRTVAVKLSHALDADTEERILREARALAAVRHPNCVRVYDIVEDAGEDGRGLAIVMEYIEGRSLSEEVRGHAALDDVAAARLWATMAGALAAAHDKGVLHRDVKPSNIIIDPSGAPHLIDFGIARRQGESTLTAAGMMMGTPDYLAPETAAGQPATPASDAWQLAATVSFALTGRPPRGERESTVSALMAAAQAQPVTHLPQQSVHRKLLAASLHPDPARRPPLSLVQREVNGWLAHAGHKQDGPVTGMLRRAEIGH
ncbi:serine/threonine-protein kinase [Gandjariella thermophila]|uniref:non-specific serine/threonine protein kinase n=1 Tax=Gandjariella thermophila TaxID=1931992 RepID=A0A4D4J7A8_9PSEU|nr:serine/threonine-protein kinase [Gandjariella thermophila]GDY29837.1 serine/threonine protein kinase [Gandjariella thermophila]